MHGERRHTQDRWIWVPEPDGNSLAIRHLQVAELIVGNVERRDSPSRARSLQGAAQARQRLPRSLIRLSRANAEDVREEQRALRSRGNRESDRAWRVHQKRDTRPVFSQEVSASEAEVSRIVKLRRVTAIACTYRLDPSTHRGESSVQPYLMAMHGERVDIG